MQKLRFLFLALGLSTWAAAQTPGAKPADPVPQNWPTINDTTYTLRFPKDWTVDQSGMFGSRFFLFAPLDSATDKFRENFNLIINDMTSYPGVTLEYLADGAKQEVEHMITDVNIQEFRIVHVGDDKYYVFEYSGKQGQFMLHWKQHFVLANNKFYVLTFTAEELQYAHYLPLVERVFSTFVLK